ncbi:2-oxoglutarate-dependent dioxygenase gloE [Metarhizium anisopliae]|nr:2-oxoglutarate-dependent dioxygenase gloE [Metarhizium anisopliae]
MDSDAAPPFPDDVPTAPLLRLSLAKLRAREPDEVRRFTAACEALGFFYLDLGGDAVLQQADALFDAGRALFDLPLAEKARYDFSRLGTYMGYKAVGASVADAAGNLDRNEFYNIGKDDVFELGRRWPAPEVLESRRALLRSFMQSAHGVVTLVLALLDAHLGLAPGTLGAMHRLLEGRGGDQVRFIRAPARGAEDARAVALGEHTDFGSVTVLFNRLGGLQVLMPPGAGVGAGAEPEWRYVRPLPGHAVVNLGDALVKFSNGLLRSNIHRVVEPPGDQAACARYSLVYFSRPEDHVVLRRLEGRRVPPLPEGVVEEAVTSEAWVLRRALGSRPALQPEGKFDYSLSRGTEAISQRAR